MSSNQTVSTGHFRGEKQTERARALRALRKCAVQLAVWMQLEHDCEPRLVPVGKATMHRICIKDETTTRRASHGCDSVLRTDVAVTEASRQGPRLCRRVVNSVVCPPCDLCWSRIARHVVQKDK